MCDTVQYSGSSGNPPNRASSSLRPLTSILHQSSVNLILVTHICIQYCSRPLSRALYHVRQTRAFLAIHVRWLLAFDWVTAFVFWYATSQKPLETK